MDKKYKKYVISVAMIFIFVTVGLTLVFFVLPTRKGGPSKGYVTQMWLLDIQMLAEVYFDKHGMYATHQTSDCADPDSLFTMSTTTVTVIEKIEAFNKNKHKATCYATEKTWAVSIKPGDNSDTRCADSTGFIGSGTAYADGRCR